jgi:tetratricopeptide (TPR) repeat protein
MLYVFAVLVERVLIMPWLCQSSDKLRSQKSCVLECPHVGFPVLFIVSVLCLSVGGCAKGVVKSDYAPFNFDRVFSGLSQAADESLRDKGIRLVREKDYESAAETFKKLVEEKTDDFFALNALAVCYKNQGDHSKAMENFEKALKIAGTGPRRAKVLANIGNLYYAAGKFQVSLGYYKEAAAEFQENPLYLALTARNFLALNERDRAGKVLANAEPLLKNSAKIEGDEDKGLTYYLIGESYLALNDEKKFFENFDKSISIDPIKFSQLLKKDLYDEQSILYTLRDDPRMRKYIKRHLALNTVAIQTQKKDTSQ